MSLEHNSEIKFVDVKILKPNPKNNNKHPQKQIERLAKVIKYQGFRSPLVVSNRSGLLVAGHARLKAAKKLGLKKVPVSYQDFTDEDQELAHLTADNALALWAELDLSSVEDTAKNLTKGFDLDFFGVEGLKLKQDLDFNTGGSSEKDDKVPEVEQNELGVELGDVYQLGDHRLMCGEQNIEYCSVIIKRWEEFSGKKASKL